MVGTSIRFTSGNTTSSKTCIIPTSSRKAKNSSSSPASLSSCISSIASPAYNPCATLVSSRGASLQLRRSCTTLVSPSPACSIACAFSVSSVLIFFIHFSLAYQLLPPLASTWNLISKRQCQSVCLDNFYYY